MKKLTAEISNSLYFEVRKDLARPHAFALERVGFLLCEYSEKAETLTTRFYSPIKDSDYLEDEFVGACINSNPIRTAIQLSLKHSLGIFHVHTHEHSGNPYFSGIDLKSLAEFMPALKALNIGAPHGGFLFSEDRFLAKAWMPNNTIKEFRNIRYTDF